MKFYKCEKCGRLIEVLNIKESIISCCGKTMNELIPGSTTANKDKHVPYCEVQGDYLKVKIGLENHPMEENHYIEWVVAEYKESIVKYLFKPSDDIEILFGYEEGMKVYAYCNLHGLWEKDF